MSKKIIGNVSVSRNTTSMGENTIRDVNGVSPDSTGNINYQYYTKEYVDQVIKVLPVSRVGSMDYLPMNINGSYEGATTYFDKRVLPVIVEDDGTLVYLRPGTNGSTNGYYFSYTANSRTVSTLTPVLTNEKYVPSFFTVNHSLISFVGSKANELLFMKTNNGTNDTYTIGLTNGTLNGVSHQYLEFNRTLIPNTDPQYAHIVGSLVYIWCIDSYDASNALDISLYTISLDDIRSGSSTSLQRVTGISGETISGATVTSSSTVRLAQKYVSTVPSDNPLLLTDSATTVLPFVLNNDGVIQAVVNDANTSVRVAVFHPFGALNAQSNSQQKMWGLSFTYNISTKAYVLDKAAGSISISTSNNQIVINDPYNVTMENINGYVTGSQGNVPTIFQTVDGLVFSTVARYITSPQHKITRSTLSTFTNLYDSWNLSTRKLTKVSSTLVDPIYGSTIGENLISPTVLSPTKVLFNCSGTSNGNTFGFDSKVYTDIGSTRNYSYKSVVTGSTINGYAPQKNRNLVDNTNNRLNGLITLIAADGSTTVYGSSFIEGTTKPANGLMDINTFNFGAPYTLSSTSLLSTLKDSIINSVSFTGNVIESKIVLYYVPNSTFGKSIASVTLRTDTKDSSGYIGHVIVSTVDVVVNANVISGLTAVNSIINGVSTDAISINTTYLSRMPGLTIAKYQGFSYIGIPAIFNIGIPANATFRTTIGKLDSNNNITAIKVISSDYVSAAGGTYEAGVMPGYGFGLFMNGDLTDFQTKLVFGNFGTTSAQLDSLIAGNLTPLETVVVASQEVPQGFNVYFTQEVPVLINGAYYKLQPTDVDLTTIDSSPANKTFYIYVYVVENICKYVISTSKLTEELNRIFIGTIVTGSNNITSIESEKVTRFLTYRVSTTKRGSAIPASTGVPSGTGTRWN